MGERRGARRKRLEVEHQVGSGEIAERLGIRAVQTVHLVEEVRRRLP
ncbi:MAG: hypothetical protein ABR540_14755 [Acidimicrobiales bacterium]